MIKGESSVPLPANCVPGQTPQLFELLQAWPLRVLEEHAHEGTQLLVLNTCNFQFPQSPLESHPHFQLPDSSLIQV